MYDLFVIDPPWPKKKGGLRSSRPNQGRELDYETMPVDEIFSLLDRDLFSRANEPHVVFMWTIDQFLFDCEQHMLDRDYRRHARIIWDKQNGTAPAFTVRYTHEYLIWYYKPKLLPISTELRGKFGTVWTGRQREHSRKPEAAYANIERLYPQATKIDVFSRQARPGWDQYGHQPDYFPPKRKRPIKL